MTTTTRAATAVEITGLVKRYGQLAALDGVDLAVPEGEVFGLLGPNGAGKTTAIETIVGLRAPTEGRVRVLGLDPAADATRLRRLVSVQPQHAALFPTLTVLETLRLWASFHGAAERPDELIAELGLEDARNVRVSRLSGGQRQRLLVATALVPRPRLTVLDEPTTGLDPNARGELWTAIRDRRDAGRTVLLSTHSMEEAEALCDRVAILDHGRVVACGPPEELVHAHAPEQLVAFTSDVAPDRDTLLALPGVAAVEARHAGGRTRVRLRTTDADGVLVTLLTGGGPRIRAIETRDVGLEEVFRRLTGRAFDEEDS